MEPENVYVAPDSTHVTVTATGRIVLPHEAPENGMRPSVSVLFRSVAAAYGPAAAGVLLTGMGKDGAIELGLMKTRGAVTFAQDEASSIVHGMPGEAIRIGAASYTLPLDGIAAALTKLSSRA